MSYISKKATDQQYTQKIMERVLSLAETALGSTMPNPLVGCIITDNGKILAEGFHNHCGGPHAEVTALNQLKNTDLKNSTLFCNLEPCCHYGRTPPCVNKIIESGIKQCCYCTA